MKEYIVTLQKGIDYDEFYDQMVETSKILNVPDRPVEIANERSLSERNTHYFLTEEEAKQLKNDPRVLAVEIPPDQRTDIKIGYNLVQNANFNKTTSSSGNLINWGLNRGAQSTNIYGSTDFPSLCSYEYYLDGTGVDVVVHDSGLQVDHPEFNDRNGNTRVQQINWYTASGVPGTQNANFYRDFDGHGTHVCGIMAGLNYGWAKNSRIYALKVNGLEGSGDSGTGIPIANCFDVVKGWHLNKPIDPKTGQRRPTVVNMSWGYSTNYSSLIGGVYRGTSWAGGTPQSIYGMINLLFFPCPVRIASVDTDIEELIDAGVVVCTAAGNNYFKIDAPGGIDYNNYFQRTGGSTVYYHRGSSPYSDRAIVTGSIDTTTNSGTERKADYSNGGNGVAVYAPGTNILSCTSNTNRFDASTYFVNASFRQVNISGTSMASPQIAGLCALYLQLNPDGFNQVKKFITNYATTGLLWTTGLDNDYTQYNSLWGGHSRFLYAPFATNYGLRILF